MSGVRKYNLAKARNTDTLHEFPAEVREHLEKAGGYEIVTAIDERDVMPLVEAAQRCLPENDDLEGLGFREVPGSRLRALTAALAPFETGDGS